MTLLRALPILLALLSTSPEQLFRAHVAAALERLCPHAEPRVAAVIAEVALADDDPDRAAVLLLAATAHETGGRDVRQVGGGKARGPFQVEMAHPTDDLEAQARWALRAARAGWQRYACGSGTCPEKAAELARSEAAARWAWAR